MSLEEIGQKLKQARESQGLSLRQIYERTKIPLAHLQAIDMGQDEELPEPVYVANYIKRYSDCVGISGQQMAEQYRKSAEDIQSNLPKIKVASAKYSAPTYFEGVKIDREPPSLKTIPFNLLWIVIVVGLVSYLTMAANNNQTNLQDPSLLSLKESTAKFSSINSAQQGQAQGNNAAQGQADAGLVSNGQVPLDTRLSLSASQHVWVEVKSLSSGQDLFTGYLEQGDRRDFQDPQGMRIRAGNGGNLAVTYQGKDETFGPAGKIAERVFGQEAVAATPVPPTTIIPDTKTLPAVKKAVSKSSEARGLATRDGQVRRVDDMGDYGSSGHSSTDVPYRYSDGRLDSE